MAKAIGIDLGTTNSVMAVLEGGHLVVIANAEGMRTTPSVVAFQEKERLVGQLAKRQGTLNPERTLYSLKRFIGRSCREVAAEIELVPYSVVSAANHAVRFEIDDELYSPEELSAMVLRKLADDASSYLGETVHDVVISVPACFNDSQRRGTMDAAQIAGLNVLRIINEPTAAALAYGLNRKKSETILIFDLGGGTLDVSVLDISDELLEVRATAGDTHLGGDNFDKEVADWLAAEFEKRHAINLSNNKQALQRLREAAERAKVELSTVLETQISLPFICADAAGPKHLDVKLGRAQFNELTAQLLERCRAPLEAALAEAKITAAEVDEVLLVGGSTRIPAVQELVQKTIGKRQIKRGVNPDEAVALGAACQAGILTGELKEPMLLDITPFPLELEAESGLISKVFEQNTAIPTRRTQLYSTAEDSQSALSFQLLQGQPELAKDDRLLGQLKLAGITPTLRKSPQMIEITFELDANGILNLSAKDKSTGKEQTISLSRSINFAKTELAQIIENADHLSGGRQK
ncbi:MAG: molecular chaperone DnaK [Dethiobacter sp.]|nr:molecular chaperone DnaK [Dethiobacter sp.]MBS3897571.1 molecular chaperone DnaK [Dethiobacter sp.]MBS3983802.1 molecular chaperone DnaK [Dethiobacter sp.]MCL4463809.1 molecular chaperone DnaK [Bacillota bacterium]MCL5993428.1 molecular chaperone DnaK [Bacillota bacterium]